MKLRLKWLFQDVEVDGTPEECAAFLKARETVPQVPPAFVSWFQVLDPCPLGGAHQYPDMYVGVPTCMKCGQCSYAPTFETHPYVVSNPMPPCRTTILPLTQTGAPFSQPEDLLVRQGCTD